MTDEAMMEKPQGQRVLIAEDEPNIAAALQFLLGRDGYSVTIVADGESVEKAVRDQAPTLLILDVMLPKMSGFEVLRSLREKTEFASLPVIMLTAKGQSQDRKTAEESGADVFVTKPFSNQEVLAHVKRLLTP
ncbi:MAG: response regulator [Neomegalonema sp.]|nr:response regulator [Neomegalonema sp.]